MRAMLAKRIASSAPGRGTSRVGARAGLAQVIGELHTRRVQGEALTRAQVRELDRLAIEELGIPSAVLMENAGRGATEAMLRLASEARAIARPRILIACGRGNNGGDG